MKHLLTQITMLLATITVYAQIPAFPGAEGGGMYTSGGRGGTVYYVTTLADDASIGNTTTKEGSLRWCLNRTGKRTILFKVSGTIMLKESLKIKNGDVTIAGQSAPGDGICIGNYPVNINADNIIIRYLRFRMGDDSVITGGADALEGRFFKNVIIDHCSMSWSTDECVSFYNCDYFTLQWCLISESLRLSTHDKGPHGYGGIWGGTNSTFHHNLLAHHDSRTPRFGPGKDIPPHTETVDHRNNVNYNYGNTYGAEAMSINIVNNYYKPGPSSPTGTKRGRIMSIDKDKNTNSIRYDVWGQFFIDGNVVNDGYNEQNCINATNYNWTYGVYNQFPSGYGTVPEQDKIDMRMSEPFQIKGLANGKEVGTYIHTHTANDAYEKVLSYVGVSHRRDSYDTRIVNETRTGTTTFKGLSPYNGYTTDYPGMPDVDWRSKGYPKYGIIDSHWDIKPADAGADWTPWPVLASETAPLDSDNDGIPDGWLDKNHPGKKATDLNEEGYTYLEVYLNSLVEEITNKQKEGAVKEDMPLGTKTMKENKLNAYYDQQTKTIRVSADDIIESVEVYSIAGYLMQSQKYNAQQVVLTMTNAYTGTAIIKATTKKEVLFTKIIL